MPRYFLHLHECGHVVEDEEGRQLPGWDGARTAAIREAREIMSAEVLQGRLCLSCHIEVVEEGSADALDVRFREALALTGV